jgi:glycosyltransferase involved in cell wall biosynthesis
MTSGTGSTFGRVGDIRGFRTRAIVAHIGARRRYAVPRMLEGFGVLSRLYTDLAIPAGAVPSRAAAWMHGGLRRRMVEDIPFSRIYSAPSTTLSLMYPRSRSAPERFLRVDKTFGNKMIQWGVGDANTVYGMYGSGTPFWHHARERGLKVAGDLFINPMWHAIVLGEQQSFPDWEAPKASAQQETELYAQLSRETIEAADMLICPSEVVRAGLHKFASTAPARGMRVPHAVVVPYGIKVSRGSARNEPVPGRLLFAGAADLRKGVQYLAAAAVLLKSTANTYEFRVAGLVADQIRHHHGARALTFLGHLSRDELDREYRRADVVVLPTLAEGSPAVIHEALAAGVPVVTTRSAGTVVTDGHEGYLVAERDSDAIAAAVERIVGNRSLRDEMARNALLTAAKFDEGPWGERLMAAMESLHV